MLMSMVSHQFDSDMLIGALNLLQFINVCVWGCGCAITVLKSLSSINHMIESKSNQMPDLGLMVIGL